VLTQIRVGICDSSSISFALPTTCGPFEIHLRSSSCSSFDLTQLPSYSFTFDLRYQAALITMSSNTTGVTLNSVVMGKRGIGYSLAEMVTILTHYDITPLQLPSRRKKLVLFQQVQELAHDQNLTTHHRRLILSGQMPRIEKSHSASSIASDTIQEPEAEGATELPMPYVKPQPSILPLFLTCSVCLEEYYYRKFSRRRITADCSHEPTICLECLQQAIDSQIRNKAWDKLACPLCNEKLTFETVKKYSSPESFEK